MFLRLLDGVQVDENLTHWFIFHTGFRFLGSDAVGLVGRFLGQPFLLSSFFGQGLGLGACGGVAGGRYAQ